MQLREAMKYLAKNLNTDNKLRNFVKKNGFDVDKILSVEDGYEDDIIYKDGGDLYIENKVEGFCFLFITENKFFCKKMHLPMLEGDWYFNTIFLYSEGFDGYNQYKELPYGLSFNMDRLEIHAVLKEDPVFNRLDEEGNIIAEKWNFDYYSIHITYIKDSSLPLIISISTYNGKFPPKKENVKVLIPEALCE